MAALLVLNAILLAPVLIYDVHVADGFSGLTDKSTIFILVMSLAWLGALHLLVRRPARLHLWLAPFFVITLVDLFLVWKFDSRLSTSYVAILVGEIAHAGDFIATWGADIALLGLPALAVYVLCVLALRGIAHRLPRWLGIGALAGVFALYGLAYVLARRATEMNAQMAVLDVLAHDKSAPFGAASQAYVAAEMRAKFQARRQVRERFRFGAAQRPPRAAPELHVLVIGESSRPDHWSINGYERPTTPRLAALPGIVSFHNAVSQVALTRESVPHILTRTTLADAADDESMPVERSVISAFAEAGFETFWLSTVQLDGFTGEVSDLASEAEYARYFEQRHDGVMLQTFDELVLNGTPGKKKFVVLHTQGSHFHYESRYPASFARFPTDGELSRRERLVNAYDNTVLYTDWFLAELIERIERWDGMGSLLYASDHGENLMDDQRNLVGHFHNNAYDLSIAVLFWASEELAAAYPHLVETARENADRPISTANVFPTLVDAAGLAVPGTRMGWSLLRPLEDHPRLVRAGNRKDAVDFDAAGLISTSAAAAVGPARVQ